MTGIRKITALILCCFLLLSLLSGCRASRSEEKVPDVTFSSSMTMPLLPGTPDPPSATEGN